MFQEAIMGRPESCGGVLIDEFFHQCDACLRLFQFSAEDRAALAGRDLEENDVPVLRVELVHEVGMPGEALTDVVQLAPLRTGRKGRLGGVGAVHGRYGLSRPPPGTGCPVFSYLPSA